MGGERAAGKAAVGEEVARQAVLGPQVEVAGDHVLDVEVEAVVRLPLQAGKGEAGRQHELVADLAAVLEAGQGHVGQDGAVAVEVDDHAEAVDAVAEGLADGEVGLHVQAVAVGGVVVEQVVADGVADADRHAALPAVDGEDAHARGEAGVVDARRDRRVLGIERERVDGEPRPRLGPRQAGVALAGREAQAAAEADEVDAQVVRVAAGVRVFGFGREADEPVGVELELVVAVEGLEQQVGPGLRRGRRGEQQQGGNKRESAQGNVHVAAV